MGQIMPILKGPMFSLGATGTLGKTITYEDHGTDQRARLYTSTTPPPTQAQTDHRTRIGEMSLSWRALPPEDRAAWSIAAAPLQKTGYTYWWQEWFAQNIYPPNIPEIPT